MPWRIELTAAAEKQLGRLGAEPKRRILRFLDERLVRVDDPRGLGTALSGSRFGELWRYRVGDYRIVVRIEDAILRVLVVRIAHRREVYRD